MAETGGHDPEMIGHDAETAGHDEPKSRTGHDRRNQRSRCRNHRSRWSEIRSRTTMTARVPLHARSGNELPGRLPRPAGSGAPARASRTATEQPGRRTGSSPGRPRRLPTVGALRTEHPCAPTGRWAPVQEASQQDVGARGRRVQFEAPAHVRQSTFEVAGRVLCLRQCTVPPGDFSIGPSLDRRRIF